MSERIDVRADITIAGAAGGAVRGELAALTRWVAAGPAGPGPAGAGVHGASGGAEECAASSGDPREPHHRLAPGPAGLRRHDRGRPHARLLRAVRAAAGAIAAARPPGRRRAAAARCGRRSGPRGHVRSWPKRTPPGTPPWPPWRKATGTRRPCSWPPGRPGWRPPPPTSSRRLRTEAPRRCRGTCAGSRRSPRRCGRCSTRSAPRPIAAPSRRTWQHRLPDSKPDCAPAAAGS